MSATKAPPSGATQAEITKMVGILRAASPETLKEHEMSMEDVDGVCAWLQGEKAPANLQSVHGYVFTLLFSEDKKLARLFGGKYNAWVDQKTKAAFVDGEVKGKKEGKKEAMAEATAKAGLPKCDQAANKCDRHKPSELYPVTPEFLPLLALFSLSPSEEACQAAKRAWDLWLSTLSDDGTSQPSRTGGSSQPSGTGGSSQPSRTGGSSKRSGKACEALLAALLAAAAAQVLNVSAMKAAQLRHQEALEKDVTLDAKVQEAQRIFGEAVEELQSPKWQVLQEYPIEKSKADIVLVRDNEAPRVVVEMAVNTGSEVKRRQLHCYAYRLLRHAYLKGLAVTEATEKEEEVEKEVEKEKEKEKEEEEKERGLKSKVVLGVVVSYRDEGPFPVLEVVISAMGLFPNDADHRDIDIPLYAYHWTGKPDGTSSDYPFCQSPEEMLAHVLDVFLYQRDHEQIEVTRKQLMEVGSGDMVRAKRVLCRVPVEEAVRVQAVVLSTTKTTASSKKRPGPPLDGAPAETRRKLKHDEHDEASQQSQGAQPEATVNAEVPPVELLLPDGEQAQPSQASQSATCSQVDVSMESDNAQVPPADQHPDLPATCSQVDVISRWADNVAVSEGSMEMELKQGDYCMKMFKCGQPKPKKSPNTGPPSPVKRRIGPSRLRVSSGGSTGALSSGAFSSANYDEFYRSWRMNAMFLPGAVALRIGCDQVAVLSPWVAPPADATDGHLHLPTNVGQLLDGMRALRQLHASGYIHGDVRPANFLFHASTATLIDFDLTRKASTNPRYPPGYKHRVCDVTRHAKAKANLPMAMEHDLCALGSIMAGVQLDGSEEDRREWQAATRRLEEAEEGALGDVIQYLERVRQASKVLLVPSKVLKEVAG